MNPEYRMTRVPSYYRVYGIFEIDTLLYIGVSCQSPSKYFNNVKHRKGMGISKYIKKKEDIFNIKIIAEFKTKKGALDAFKDYLFELDPPLNISDIIKRDKRKH